MNTAIFVLDSVLFDLRHRQHLVEVVSATEDRLTTDSSKWREYWDLSLKDTPLPALHVAAALLNQGCKLLLVSGRPDRLIDQTRDKVEQALQDAGADPAYFSNISYDLQYEGANYRDRVDNMIDRMLTEGANLLMALIKNNGMASALRSKWPTATICNMGRFVHSRG